MTTAGLLIILSLVAYFLWLIGTEIELRIRECPDFVLGATFLLTRYSTKEAVNIMRCVINLHLSWYQVQVVMTVGGPHP